MKKVFLSLVLVFSVTLSFAQYHPRRTVEVEIGAGILQSFNKMFFDRVTLGASLYAEVKYVFKNIPLDLGVNASAQMFERISMYTGTGISINTGCLFPSWNLMAVSDYSFYSASRIRLYGGLGIGGAFFELSHNTKAKDGGFSDTADGICNFCVMPRVGINFANRFNLALGYLFEDSANANLNLRLGFVF